MAQRGPRPKSNIRDNTITFIQPPGVGGQQGSETCPDFFVGSDVVTLLDEDGFYPFLRTKDAALVMFYDPCNEACGLSKDHFILAAQTNSRPTGVFAAVNCDKTPDICYLENAESLPFFRLYSRSFTVGTIREYNTFVAELMRKYVEMCPVLCKPPQTKPDKLKKPDKCSIM